MANPTSNFNWQMPTPTDLVTDLPADFEVFGQAVDSSMADLLGGTTGQILAKNSNTNMDFVWVTNDVGDITAVTAGTGISGGGTSGAVTVTNSMATTITTKGDLVPGTGSGTFARLAAGANDLVLSAASGETTGLKYAGAWTTYTPTWTNLTVGNGTLVARYCQVGKVVTVMIRLTFGSTTAVTGGFTQFSVPVTSAISQGSLGTAYFLDNGVADYPGWVKQDGTGAFAIQPINAAGTFAALGNLTATNPFTWGTNDVLNVQVSYEAA